MPQPKLSREKAQEAMDALRKADGNMLGAARALGIAQGTIQNRIRTAETVYGMERPKRPDKPPAPSTAAPLLSPEERRDADFWRRRYQEASKDLEETRHALREVAGLAGRKVTIPQWALPRPGKPQAAVGLLHLSDLHVGEVVRPEEVNGVNAYDIDTFRRRMRRCITAAIDLLPRWASDCQLQGIVVAVNGDLVSGSIHDELAQTNELTSLEQVMVVVEEVGAALVKLRDTFGSVHAVFTPGNHGRVTHKTHAKRTAALNYDCLIGSMSQRALAGESGITVHVAPGSDAVYPVLGWTVFQSHGDAIGTGGGKGFAGPILPIARGARAVEYQASLVRQYYDIILTAHYHTSANPGGGRLANVSMVGYSEFAHRIRAAVEPPKQWLALITERWPLRERVDLMLEDPPRAEKPRIRIAAA